MKSQFDSLLEELGTMAKAMPAEGDEGDKKIAAAAAESGVEATGEVDGAAGAEDGGGEGDGDGDEGKVMAKSFTLTLDDGTKVDALDGTELLKALMERVDGIESGTGKLVKGMMGVISTQSAMLKAMGAKLDEIAGAGRGRKAVVTVTEKPAAGVEAATEEPKGMGPDEFLGKCLIAQGKGLISGVDVAISENRIANGVQPADHVKQAVLSLA